jgi:hypothetical protein
MFKLISTLLFEKLCAWAICNAKMMFMILFFLRNVETKWLGVATLVMTLENVILLLVYFFGKNYTNASFYVNLCATCIYYVMHKQDN